MAGTTLEDAVKNAVAQETTETHQNETESSVETKKEDSTEQKTEETKQPTEAETIRQAKLDKAIRLYEALEDPNVGPVLLRQMVEKAGMQLQPTTKTEEKQVTKTVVEVLKESLGTEYEFLADRLADGIDQIVKQIVKQEIQPVQAQTREAVERAVASEVDAEFEKFYAKHADAKNNKDLDQEMQELSKEIPYTGDYPMERYLERLYKLATADKKEATVVKKTVDKINKNAQELRDSSTEVQETRVKTGSKLPSLDEAVKAAFRNEKFV